MMYCMLLLYGAMLYSVARCIRKQKANCRKLKTTSMTETQTATKTRTVMYLLMPIKLDNGMAGNHYCRVFEMNVLTVLYYSTKAL